jgi:hypothetical protein
MAQPLALSPARSTRIEWIGAERKPLVIVDDCLAGPEAVRAIAARAPFAPIGPHYPGLRSPVPQAAVMPLLDPLAELLTQTFALPGPPTYDECYLSLVTLRAEQLAPIQRLPHFDGVEPDRLALLLYLDPAERGGTAFYRQRATAFETVDCERFEQFRRELETGIAAHGIPPAAYIRSDTPLYERIGEVAGRFNRAVIYHGNSLHCADLAADFAPTADPLAGRLTLNLFLRAAG